MLLRALARLAENGVWPTLSIVGDGPERATLVAMAGDLGLRQQIEFLGNQDHDALPAILNRHRMLVVPSLWDEPFGIVALEGSACGCVVVGSSGGGLPEAIGPCGATFPNGDDKRLAELLTELLADESRLETFRQAAPGAFGEASGRSGSGKIPGRVSQDDSSITMAASTYAPPGTPARSVAGSRAVAVPRWDVGVALIAGVLLLTILEGAARKWLFADNPPMRYAAYLSKDILFVLAAYLGLQRGRRFDLTWLGICALLILVPSALGTFENSNLVGAGLSIRAYLVVPLCAFLAVPLVRHFVDIERCAMVVALAAIPVAALGVMQYRLPPGHILNRYDADDAHSVNVGRYVRATGTFSYIAGMTTMACLAAWSGVLLAGPAPGGRRFVRALGMAAIAAGGVCAAVSMSRGAVLGWGFVCVGAVLLYLPGEYVPVFLMLAGAAGDWNLILIRPGDNFENAVGENSIARAWRTASP